MFNLFSLAGCRTATSLAFPTENFTSFPGVYIFAEERHPAACLEMVAASSMQDKRWKMPLARKRSWN